MTSQPTPSYLSSPSRPSLRLPAGACDAHCHIFGPHSVFPFAEGRSFTPADAPKEKLFALHAMLGIEHSVIVQSGCHGFDNRVVADALAAKNGTYRGVALLPTTVADDELHRLDVLGFCGIRFNFMKHLGKSAPIADVVALGDRLAGLGWHLQIHLDSSLIADFVPYLRRSAVPVVVDHMGRIDAALGLDQPAFRHLLALMEDERFWVKVSGCDRSSRLPSPYEDAVPFARKLVAEFGNRAVWGTDWPHPNPTGAIPDDGVLVDLVAAIAPTAAQQRALLVDNPRRLYRFGKP